MEPRDVEPRELRSLAGVMGDGGFFPLFPLISCRGTPRPACIPGVSRAVVPLAPVRPPPAPVVRTGRADGCAPLPSGITALVSLVAELFQPLTPLLRRLFKRCFEVVICVRMVQTGRVPRTAPWTR